MRSRKKQPYIIGISSLMSVFHMKNCIESISDKVKEIRALTLHFYGDFFPLNNDLTRSRFIVLKERVAKLKAEILAMGSVLDPEALLPSSYDLNILMAKINGKLFRMTNSNFQMMKTVSGETFILLFETMNVFMHFQKPGDTQSMNPALIDIVFTSSIDGRNYFSMERNNNNANSNGNILMNPQMKSSLVEVDGRLVNEGLKRRVEKGCGVSVAESLVWQRITWFVKKIYLFQVKYTIFFFFFLANE